MNFHNILKLNFFFSDSLVPHTNFNVMFNTKINLCFQNLYLVLNAKEYCMEVFKQQFY